MNTTLKVSNVTLKPEPHACKQNDVQYLNTCFRQLKTRKFLPLCPGEYQQMDLGLQQSDQARDLRSLN